MDNANTPILRVLTITNLFAVLFSNANSGYVKPDD